MDEPENIAETELPEEESGGGKDRKGRRYLINIAILLLALLLLFGLQKFLMSMFFPSAGSGKSIAELSYLFNRVVRRAARAPDFKKAALDLDLFQNDAIRTFEDSYADVTFIRGGEIRLDQNTLIILKGYRDGLFGFPGRFSVVLENGNILLNLEGSEKDLIHFISTPNGDLMLNNNEWGGKGVIGIELQADGNTRVINYSGSGPMTINGKEFSINQNEFFLFNKGQLGQTANLPPSNILIQPGQEPTIFAQKIGQEVTFDWEKDPETNVYQVQVSRDMGFNNLVAQAHTPNDYYTFKVVGSGPYHWRVRSVDPIKPWVTEGKFNILFDDPNAFENVIIDPQKNVVDDRNEKTIIFFQSDYPLVTFSWRPTKRARSYRLEVFQDPNFEHLALAQNTPETTFSTEPGLFRDANYYWQVIALSKLGEPIQVSDVFKLFLVFDNAVPFLKIFKPNQDEVFNQSTIKVAGVLPKDAQVFVNGKPFEIDSRGKFTGDLELPLGTSHVIFKAIGLEERVEYHARTITIVPADMVK